MPQKENLIYNKFMASFDSTIRLRQINQPELSGYTVQIIEQYLSGYPTPSTGNLTGAFYPLQNNVSGYVTSGQTGVFKTQTDLDSLYSQVLSYVSSNYYPSSNPNQYISSGSIPTVVSFVAPCTSGVDNETIVFPNGGFPTSPRVIYSFQNIIDSYVYSSSISNILNWGFNINYSDTIRKSGYTLNVVAVL